MRHHPHAPRRTSRHALAPALVLLVLLSGCGLRLETDPPPPLVPDAAEEVRQRTVADALTVATTARLAAEGLPVDDDAAGDDVAALLHDVAQAADAHVEALGGVYDPGTDPADDGDDAGDPGDVAASEGDVPAGTDDGTADGADVADVLELLRETAVTARADALTVDDGALARLLGSIALHRAAAADALGGPPPAGSTDAEAESDAAAADAAPEPPVGDDPGDDGGRAGASGTDGNDGTEAADDAGEVDDPRSGPSTTADPTAIVALVRAEDAAGQAWEVVAARRSDDARESAAARASAHRDAARLWVLAAGLTGPDDPRLAEYALEPGLVTGDASDDVLARLERDLAARYLALLAAEGADSGGRARLLDAATDAVVVARTLDGTLEPLPGMPEQQP